MRRRIVIASVAGAWCVPCGVVAQTSRKLSQIGFLSPDAATDLERDVDIFLAGLLALGHAEGRDFHVEYRYAEGDSGRLPSRAAELVARKVDMIVTYATGTAAARKASDRIPIVQVAGPDPVAAGLAQSLARPNGNVTGLSIFVAEIMAKRLELLRELNPSLERIGVLLFRSHAANPSILGAMGSTAKALGLELHPAEVAEAAELRPALASWREAKVQAIVVHDHSFFALGANARELASITIRQKIPLIGAVDQCRNGALMSYGVNIQALFARSASYVDRIIRGARPGDLPIEQPSQFQYVVNLGTAKALGVVLPPSILVRADEIVE